jgi:hypothetical protein
MSLDTLINIGNKIRTDLNKKDSLAYHRYVKKAPLGSAKMQYSYFQLDINYGFVIDKTSLKPITDEDYINNSLYFLRFKTGEADSLVKYIFGDVCSDYFKLDNPSVTNLFGFNSFVRGKEDAITLNNPKITAFRNSFNENIDFILDLLRQNENCFIHFNYSGKSWYELEDVFEVLETYLIKNFIKEIDGHISLTAFLTRTLIDTEGSVPDFNQANTHKCRSFEGIDTVKDLIYGLDFQQQYKILQGDIMINMLPKGNLSANDIIRFFQQKSKYDYKNQSLDDVDPFVEPVIGIIEKIEKYDIIFSKRSKPIGIDLLEITDVDQNLLKLVSAKIQNAKKIIGRPITLGYAIKMIFEEKKYTSHLLRILPLIYRDAYYTDESLLPAFLQKVEYSIRHGEGSFNSLKAFYYFLLMLQKNDNTMEIKESKSYLVGQCLGAMAEPFAAWRKDCPMKSFEKSYVGSLSRRISNLDDLVELANYLNEKLLLHNKAYPSIKQAYSELVSSLDAFKKEEKYNRHYCELGFFESYYRTYKEQPANAELETAN